MSFTRAVLFTCDMRAHACTYNTRADTYVRARRQPLYTYTHPPGVLAQISSRCSRGMAWLAVVGLPLARPGSETGFRAAGIHVSEVTSERSSTHAGLRALRSSTLRKTNCSHFWAAACFGFTRRWCRVGRFSPISGTRFA
eukprot:9436683-Pyramimonas_sp.AAC.1